MSQRDRLPEGLAKLPPGPALATALATVDPSTLNGHDLVTLAPVLVKMISHLQANLAEVLSHAEYCPPGDADSPAERQEQPFRWAGVEVAAKLHWSNRKVEQQLGYAFHMVRRVPLIHAALQAGIIDWDHARTIVDGVRFLDDQAAQEITARVLADGAATWTVRKLSDRLRREAVAYDTAAAQRRRRERQRERRVEAAPHPDGTANLYGWNLPPERVTEIMERISAIARTAKRQGDQRTVDQLMADSFCDLLAGTGIGATPAGPVTNPGPTGRAPDQYGEPAGDPVDEHIDWPTDEPEPGAGPDPFAEHEPEPSPEPFSEHKPDQHAPDQAGSGGAVVPLPGPRRGVIHLLAPLSTVVGLSQEPGELVGYGPVAADIVRQVIANTDNAQWRYSIYDDHDGQLLDHGITHTRPTPPPNDQAPNGQEQSGFTAADAAFIRARDRTCRGPTDCNTPATNCEVDHTIAKADGGSHEVGNGGPLCTRDHHFKHESGATLEQLQPGVFLWTSAFGHSYLIRPEPYHEATGPPETTHDRPSHAARRLTRILTTTANHHPEQLKPA